MLSLLSRIVLGGEVDNNNVEDDDVFHEASSTTEDTDEELVSPPPPTISIDVTEVGEDALHLQHRLVPGYSDSSDPGEDSALDREVEAPVELPGEDVCRRILELVEYYLSEHNLAKDMFMLKHVTKHRQGFVSLKLLATYKKVKRLTKDWRVVAHALQESEMLEINSERTKVRRRNSLPQALEEDTRPFRTVLAACVTGHEANMNTLAEFFGKFGDMVSLQMHKPGGRALKEVRQLEREQPGLGEATCALVEYEKVHLARQAVRYMANNPDCGLRVLELPRPRHQKDCLLNTKFAAHADGESAYYSNSDYSEAASPVLRFKRAHNLKSPYWLTGSLSSSPSPVTGRRGRWSPQSSPESSPPSPFTGRRGCATPSSSPEGSAPTWLEAPKSSPLPRRQLGMRGPPARWGPSNNNNETDSSLPPSPWLQRRAFCSGAGSAVSSPAASPNLRRRHDGAIPLPDNVTRLPRGPDGSRGFVGRRLPGPGHA